MNKYQVLMHVKAIFLLFDDKPKLVGYYQTLKIEADSPDKAEIKAVETIRNDYEIKSIWVKERQKEPPMIFAEKIIEVEEFNKDISGDRTGRVYYPAKHWWQFWK